MQKGVEIKMTRKLTGTFLLILACSLAMISCDHRSNYIEPTLNLEGLDAGQIYQNPVLDGYADPDVLLYEGTYYLYATGGPGGYQVYTSKDLAEWTWEGLAVAPNLWGIATMFPTTPIPAFCCTVCMPIPTRPLPMPSYLRPMVCGCWMPAAAVYSASGRVRSRRLPLFPLRCSFVIFLWPIPVAAGCAWRWRGCFVCSFTASAPV